MIFDIIYQSSAVRDVRGNTLVLKVQDDDVIHFLFDLIHDLLQNDRLSRPADACNNFYQIGSIKIADGLDVVFSVNHTITSIYIILKATPHKPVANW